MPSIYCILSVRSKSLGLAYAHMGRGLHKGVNTKRQGLLSYFRCCLKHWVSSSVIRPHILNIHALDLGSGTFLSQILFLLYLTEIP